MLVFAEQAPANRIHAIVKEFHKSYNPEFAMHPKLEKAQSDLLDITKKVFFGLRSHSEDHKKVCDLFDYKEKFLLEEIDRKDAARAHDLEELIILRKYSQKTKYQLTACQKALEDEKAKNKAVVENSQKIVEELKQKP